MAEVDAYGKLKILLKHLQWEPHYQLRYLDVEQRENQETLEVDSPWYRLDILKLDTFRKLRGARHDRDMDNAFVTLPLDAGGMGLWSLVEMAAPSRTGTIESADFTLCKSGLRSSSVVDEMIARNRREHGTPAEIMAQVNSLRHRLSGNRGGQQNASDLYRRRRNLPILTVQERHKLVYLRATHLMMALPHVESWGLISNATRANRCWLTSMPYGRYSHSDVSTRQKLRARVPSLQMVGGSIEERKAVMPSPDLRGPEDMLKTRVAPAASRPICFAVAGGRDCGGCGITHTTGAHGGVCVLTNMYIRKQRHDRLVRVLSSFFRRPGYETELEPRVGEGDARRTDLRVRLEGLNWFIDLRVISLIDREADRRAHSRTDAATLFGSFAANAAQPHALLDARTPQEASFFVAVPNRSVPEPSLTISDEQRSMELLESPVESPTPVVAPESNTDPEYLLMFPNDSAEDALDKSLAMMDRRFLREEDEKRRKYHDVPNFVPFIISEEGLMSPEARRHWRYWGRLVPSMVPLTQELCHVLLNSLASTQEF